MKIRTAQISVILITLLFSGCFTPPEFSSIPNIEFNDLRYMSYAADRDSMILVFNFEDGDGDIGLGSEETYTPYHPVNYVVDSRDSLVTYSDTSVVLPLFLADPRGATSFFSEEDNRPLYNCSNYQVLDYRGESDTFYIQKNEYHNNLHIEFQRKRNNQYTRIDFASEFGNTSCDVVVFNGRIPIFDMDNLGRSLNGSISYAMLSAGFPIVLRQDTFRLKFYIYDRELNKSNEVLSPDLTLREVTVNK